MNRTEAREIAFKILFSNNFFDNGFDEEIFANILENEGQKCNEHELDFIKSMVLGVKDHKDSIIDVISRNLSAYKFERLYSVDKVALILSTYELMYNKETPFKVAINETLNIVKKYSTDKSVAFVNSVLDKIYRDISNE